MATERKEWETPVIVEREDREAVLAVISVNPSITIEELLHHLPWMRWGYLFSILGECQQEGLVAFSQKEFQFEIRTMPVLQNGMEENVRTGPVPGSGDRRTTI
jgi:hypothetical protein